MKCYVLNKFSRTIVKYLVDRTHISECDIKVKECNFPTLKVYCKTLFSELLKSKHHVEFRSKFFAI